MNFGSVCSGIEAASVSWEPLGWTPKWFSEVASFPSKFLAHRYPGVPNHGSLVGLSTRNVEPVDVLVGGTPCQSFSVAGLRGGLADERGNLALEFCRLAAALRDRGLRWVVWENVPGVLSSNKGRDITSILDALEDLGFIVDIDIIDARFCGVPQRRRRVFICGENVDFLVRSKTDSSALTIGQCWLEILHGILVSVSQASVKEPRRSGSAYLSRDGVTRRMKLFGLHGERENYDLLLDNLVAAFQRHPAEPRSWDAPHGESGAVFTPADPSTGSPMEDQFTLTEGSLRTALADAFAVMKSFITSTGTNSITPAQISMCSRAALLIVDLILRLNPSSPPFWNAASSGLAALKEFTKYARQSSSDLFGDMERVSSWRDFIRQAGRSISSLGHLGNGAGARAVLFEPEGVRRNPPPRKEAWQNVAGTPGGGSGGHGWSSDLDRTTFVPEVAGTLSRFQDPNQLDALAHVVLATNAEGANGFTLTKSNLSKTVNNQTPLAVFGVAASFDPTQITSKTNRSSADPRTAAIAKSERPPHVALCVNARQDPISGPISGPLDTDGSSQAVLVDWRVRRLMPVECERLQGFSDGHTLIPGASDSVRYAALGNSMAVPVMTWLGRRIQLVDDILRRAA